MAKAKIDRKKFHGGKVKGGSGDVTESAAGAGPTQPNRTPAPDVISRPKASKNGAYGENQYSGPSSLTPLDDDNAGRSPLGINMSQTSEGDSDPVLNAIIQKGVGAGGIDPLTGDATTMAEGQAGSQIRKIAAGNCPPAFGMKSPNKADEKVPATLGASNGPPVRQP